MSVWVPFWILGHMATILDFKKWLQLQMFLFPNALCCSLYECNWVCAVTKSFTKFLPANNFRQLLRVTRKCSCISAGKAQVQLHFQDDQQRAFGISNISNWFVMADSRVDTDVLMEVAYSCNFLAVSDSSTCPDIGTSWCHAGIIQHFEIRGFKMTP